MIVHEAELKECTFAPKINERPSVRMENINVIHIFNIQIHDRLYNLGLA